MTMKKCECGSYLAQRAVFKKFICECEKQKKLKEKMKQKIKIKILKFLITDNNFYDRERLMQLSERPLFSVIYCGIYRKFLKLFVEKKNKIHVSVDMAKGGSFSPSNEIIELIQNSSCSKK